MERLSLGVQTALGRSPARGALRRAHQRYRHARVLLYKLRYGDVDESEQTVDAIESISRQMVGQGLRVERIQVNPAEYEAFIRAAAIPEAVYSDLYRSKLLEHFLSVQVLKPRPADVIVDVACFASPFAAMLRRLYGCQTYRQDLLFPPGIHGDRIGGNAAKLPLADASIRGMTLHNSLEHFEGDSDSLFIREAARVLQPGGSVCIVPLDMSATYSIRTDPTLRRRNLTFDERAVVLPRPGLGQRHERFYDVAALQRRILNQSSLLRPSLTLVTNVADVCPGGKPLFVLTLEHT
ncbi:MAG TPA: methyltransferase domain-containing protein [Ktedonobacterales bacterium]